MYTYWIYLCKIKIIDVDLGTTTNKNLFTDTKIFDLKMFVSDIYYIFHEFEYLSQTIDVHASKDRTRKR